MAKNNDPATNDQDDGTWHQPAQSDPTLPPQDLTRRKAPDLGSLDDKPAPHHNTVAGSDSTPPPFDTAGGKGSRDSDEATPKPGTEGSDEWNRLPAPTIEKGQVVFGKYLLEEKIGEGGMGQVWRVANIPLDREVALKLIRPEYAQNKNGWLRFEREARLMAKIDHPNVVAVHALGRAQSLGYIEMEFVPGRSLEKYLKERKRGPVPLEWTAQLLDQLCSVLQKAHGHIDKKSGKVKPIIHRDLKPSNLILVDGLPDGQNLKVLDFGIAKMVKDEGSPELTGQGDFVGTPYYMSPEQIQGGVSKGGRGEIDGRSDLYSVGVLLYQLLTQALPFTGRNNMEVLVAHLHQKPLPMKEANPDVHVPAQVEQVVMSCLEKDPDSRPRSARQLAELFRQAAGQPKDPEPPGPRWRIIAPAVLGLFLVGVGIAVFWSRSVPARPPENTTPTPAKNTSVGKPVWEPPGYKAVNPKDLAANSAHEPSRLKSEGSNIEFYRLKTGAYIPLDYEPESADITDPVDLVWPRVIVHRLNKARRFIRIPIGTYQRGDIRTGPPRLDFKQNSCDPHWVRVSGFYIQETEVTHGEIEDYLAPAEHPEAAESLRRWREYYDSLRSKIRPPERARRFPAVCVSYLAARKFAEHCGGRLPREAEWEYAAKSCRDSFLFAWGNERIGAAQNRLKVNLANPRGPTFGPLEVGSSTDDQTEQHVFDLTGNVREFCLDAYKSYSEIIPPINTIDEPLVDPCVGVDPNLGNPAKYYIVRGGSFMLSLQKAMAFLRCGMAPDETADDVGFRIVIDCPPQREIPQ